METGALEVPRHDGAHGGVIVDEQDPLRHVGQPRGAGDERRCLTVCRR
jgi:hypothetical protein